MSSSGGRSALPPLRSRQVPTITAGAYSIGDAVGGMMTFPLSALTNYGGLSLGVTVVDLDNQRAEFDLLFFNQPFTPTADNGVPAYSAADAANILGSINIAGATYKVFGSGGTAIAVATLTNQNLPFAPAGNNINIYAQAICRTAPTYSATSGKLAFIVNSFPN